MIFDTINQGDALTINQGDVNQGDGFPGCFDQENRPLG